MSAEAAVQAHRAAVVAALLGLVGNALAIAGFWSLPAFPLRYLQVLGLVVCASALGVLWHRRDRPSAALGNALFLIVLLPTVAMVWVADEGRAAAGGHWVPYEPNKLSVLTLAVISPPGWWAGLVGISLFVGSALVHHQVMPDAVRASMSSGEPFGIIAYGAFALVLLAFMQRRRALEAALARARAEKLALERVAHVALSLRDLANTPTQTLELLRHELPSDDPRLGTLLERMQRALGRLTRLSEILSRYAEAVPWDHTHDSFDAEAEAEALLGGRADGTPTRTQPRSP